MFDFNLKHRTLLVNPYSILADSVMNENFQRVLIVVESGFNGPFLMNPVSQLC